MKQSRCAKCKTVTDKDKLRPYAGVKVCPNCFPYSRQERAKMFDEKLWDAAKAGDIERFNQLTGMR